MLEDKRATLEGDFEEPSLSPLWKNAALSCLVYAAVPSLEKI